MEVDKFSAMHALYECMEPIDTVPQDGTEVLVFAWDAFNRVSPEYKDVYRPMITKCAYHKDAGWCVDDMRVVNHWFRGVLSGVNSKTQALEDATQFMFTDPLTNNVVIRVDYNYSGLIDIAGKHTALANYIKNREALMSKETVAKTLKQHLQDLTKSNYNPHTDTETRQNFKNLCDIMIESAKQGDTSIEISPESLSGNVYSGVLELFKEERLNITPKDNGWTRISWVD